MSESKSKTAKPTATESEANATTTATAPASALAAPGEPGAPTVKPAKDPHHGHGGAYEIRDGQRVLVQRTARNH